MHELEPSRRRLRRGRILFRLAFAVAIAAPVAVGLAYIAAPAGFGPMFRRAWLTAEVLPWLGVLGVIVGFVWMVRLARADPEAGVSPWRYRDF